MNILNDITIIIKGLGFVVETGILSKTTSDAYVIITPSADSHEFFVNDRSEFASQEVRISIFSKGRYIEMKDKILDALQEANYTITHRQYVGHEDDTGYHHYAVDIVKLHPTKE